MDAGGLLVGKRNGYRLHIPLNRGTQVPGTNVTVYKHRGLATGIQGGRKVPPVWTATCDGLAVPGYYATEEAALWAATHLSRGDIVLHLSVVYDPRGECRPLTIWDLTKLEMRLKEGSMHSR